MAAAVYAAGFVAMLAYTRAGAGERLVAAVLWPIGPLACVVTVTMLVLVAAVVWPWVGALLVGGVIVTTWLWR